MNDSVKFEVLNSLLTRVHAAARVPTKPLTVILPPRTYEAEDLELAEYRTKRNEEEALMLTYIAKLEFVANLSRSLGLDHTTELDSWIARNPKLPFVHYPGW